MNTTIAVVIALVAALLFGVGFVMQQREAAEASGSSRASSGAPSG